MDLVKKAINDNDESFFLCNDVTQKLKQLFENEEFEYYVRNTIGNSSLLLILKAFACVYLNDNNDPDMGIFHLVKLAKENSSLAKKILDEDQYPNGPIINYHNIIHDKIKFQLQLALCETEIRLLRSKYKKLKHKHNVLNKKLPIKKRI